MLTDADRAHFRAHGWLIVRNAVDPARVAELEAALDAVVHPGAYQWGYEGKVVEVASISMGSALIKAHAQDRRLGKMAADALGVAAVQLFQDTVFIKPAHTGGPVAWHQDGSYFAFLKPANGLAMRLALTPETAQAGCLQVIDGSHLWGLQTGDLSFRATSVEDALSLLPNHLRSKAKRLVRTLELQPGDVSMHHCLTLHSSGPNASPAIRKTLAVRVMDAACTVELARVPEEHRARVPTDEAGRLRGEAYPVLD